MNDFFIEALLKDLSFKIYDEHYKTMNDNKLIQSKIFIKNEHVHKIVQFNQKKKSSRKVILSTKTDLLILF